MRDRYAAERKAGGGRLTWEMAHHHHHHHHPMGFKESRLLRGLDQVSRPSL